MTVSSFFLVTLLLFAVLQDTTGYAFIGINNNNARSVSSFTSSSQLATVMDDQVLQGAAVAALGLGVGIGLVAFTESQGERAKARGGGLSESMSTKIGM
jgi:hypothetical protein